MQLITAISLLFGASVMASPQRFGNRVGNRFGDNDGFPATGCTCTTNGNIDQDLGQRACWSLGNIWPNLQFDWATGTCMDRNRVGLEPNGWEAACQRVSQQDAPWDNTAFQPEAVRGACF